MISVRHSIGRGPTATIALIVIRQIRTSVVAVTSLVTAMLAGGIGAFNAAGGKSGIAAMGVLLKSPALQSMYGVAYNPFVGGGFSVWRYGAYVSLAVAIWAVLAATKVTRAAEDAGTWDLVAVQPIARERIVLTTAAVLFGAAIVIGLGAAIGFVAMGADVWPAMLYSLSLTAIGWLFAAVGLVAAQMFEPRRRATTTGLAVVGFMFVVRMIADGTPRLTVLRWCTPFGWIEEVRAFAANRSVPTLALIVVALAAAAIAIVSTSRRDVGASLIRTSEWAKPKVASLTSPLRFALRIRIGSIVSWCVAMFSMAFMLGTISKSIADFATSESYRRLVEQFKMSEMFTVLGYIALINVIFCTALAVEFVASMRAEGADEVAHRVDLPFAFGLSRRRWFLSVCAAGGLATVAASVSTGLGTWFGSVAGGSSISLFQAVGATVNTLPVAVAIGGVVVLLHGAAPRVAVLFGWCAIASSLLVYLFGPALRWPRWALDLSPFQHLAAVPAEPVAWLAAVLLCATGGLAALGGVVAYNRRDLV